MVIKVSFSRQIDPRHSDTPLVLTKFFEVDTLENKSRIIGKLKEMGCELESETIPIDIHDQDAATMRSNGILVPRIYDNCGLIEATTHRDLGKSDTPN
ncbi:MAG: hypothetical protein ACREQO_07675 [Candidatus Binatia bacterium]